MSGSSGQVVSVGLRITNNKTLAEAQVEVVLRRRVGYPVISIYVPTVILLTLAYLSLVFRRDNFEARVMSALTVLLVLAALFTQVNVDCCRGYCLTHHESTRTSLWPLIYILNKLMLNCLSSLHPYLLHSLDTF